MKPSEAIEKENQRQDPSTWNKIYLHKDGSFYHAYEWSAWLIKTIICTEEFQKQRNDSVILSAIRYNNKKSLGEYVIVGFPLTSLSKYIPTYKDTDLTESGDIIVEIEIPDVQNKSYNDLYSDFVNWKESCEIKEQKQKEPKPKSSISIATKYSMGLFSIATQVLSYPLESSSAQDNIDFIATLRKQVANLL